MKLIYGNSGIAEAALTWWGAEGNSFNQKLPFNVWKGDVGQVDNALIINNWHGRFRGTCFISRNGSDILLSCSWGGDIIDNGGGRNVRAIMLS